MTRMGPRALAGWLGLLLVAGGCAGARGPGAEPSERIVRPEAPPEYDYLVAREFEFEGRLDEAFEAYQRAQRKDPTSSHLLRKLAEMAARRTELDQAVAYGEQALALDPDAEDLRLFLGTLQRFRRDAAAAERVLIDASGQPISTDAAILLYQVRMEAGQTDQARRTAEWMVEHDPQSLAGVVALAQAVQQSGDPAQAETVLRDAMERGLDEVALLQHLAVLRSSAGDRGGEIAAYRELLERHPNHQETLGRLAEALDGEGRVEEAREVLTVLEREHDDTLATIRLGYFDLRDGNYEDAENRLQRVLARDPRRHEVSYLLGVVRRRRGDTDGALAAFEQVPPGHSRFVDARTQMAAILERNGDYAGALRHVELAREHQTAQPLDLYIASLRSKSGDFEGAVAFLEQLLADSPNDAEVLYNLGVIYGEAGRESEAIAYMQRALEQNPDHPGAMNYIGYTWAEQGQRLDEAEKLVVRALALRPDDGYITDSLGWIYYMRARSLLERGELGPGQELLKRSIAELEKAAELTGGDPVISEHLGDAYLLLNDKERALENYEEALELEPREGEQPHLRDKTESLRRELGLE